MMVEMSTKSANARKSKRWELESGIRRILHKVICGGGEHCRVHWLSQINETRAALAWVTDATMLMLQVVLDALLAI